MHIRKAFLGHPIIDNIFTMLKSKKCENLGGIKATPYKFNNDYVK